MSDSEKIEKPIIIKVDTKELMWLCLRQAVLVLGAVMFGGLALFCAAFNFAIATPNALNVILAGIGGGAALFCSTYFIDAVKNLFWKGVTTTVLYSDIMVVQTYRQKLGAYAEEVYRISDFTQAKEYKNYIRVVAAFVGGAVIDKRGLTDSELNAVRKLFRLPVSGDTERVLPPSGGRALPVLSELVPTDGKRVIKSAFGKYFSRDKRFALPKRIAAWLIVPACMFGMLCYGTWCYMYGTPPAYAVAVMWISMLALMADAVWIISLRSSLKQSERSEKAGHISEYLFFSDGFVVFAHSPNDFTFKFVPYGRVARVHENKTDLYLDYPNRRSTYPVVKAELLEAEYNTLRALLKKPHDGEILELDPAPDVNADTVMRDRTVE